MACKVAIERRARAAYAAERNGMIRNLLLDLDDTLLDFHRAEKIALTRALTEAGVEVTDDRLARYSEINASRWHLLEEKKITRPEVLFSRFEIFFRELGVDADAHAVQKAYETYLSIGHFFMPGAKALLDTLFPRYRLYLASNGTASVQAGRIASAGIAKYFCEMFISENVGADKPDPAFFAAVFAKIPGFRKEETLMVGDSLTSDIRGGCGAGIRTVWYNPKHKPGREDIHPTYEIDDLSGLPALIERISAEDDGKCE